VLKTISPGPSFGTDLAVTLNGTQLYVANFSGTVSIINVATYQLEKTLTLGSNASIVAMSPDGKSAYVGALNGSGGPSYLAKIDVASQTIVAPQLGAGHFHHGLSALAFSPDSQTVYAPEGEKDVLALNAVTGQLEFKVVLSTQPQFFLGGAQISPSGKYLYVVESTANAVVIINTLQGTQVGTPVAVGNSPVSIMIAGYWIYVVNDTPGSRRVRGTVSVLAR
jgi:YVTN family beta-propeller protein